MSGVIRAAIVGSLEAFLRRSYPKLAVDELVRAAGLPAQSADADADAVVNVGAGHRLFAAAAAATGDPGLGLAFASAIGWKDLGLLGYVVLNSPTLGAALANAGRYFAIQSSAGRTELAITGDAATLTHTVDGIERADAAAEFVLAMFARLGREGTGRAAWVPREVHLRHRAPRPRAPHQRHFGAPVLFEQAADALVLAPADLRLPMVAADPALLSILVRHADAVLAQMPAAGDDIDVVRRAIATALRSGDAAIEDIAGAVGTSPRSLQRRLQAGGLTFKDLVAETRLALARRYLGDPALSLTETAFLLGYADLSAFSRAFRRWTGETAQDARRRARAG